MNHEHFEAMLLGYFGMVRAFCEEQRHDPRASDADRAFLRVMIEEILAYQEKCREGWEKERNHA